MLVPLTLDDVVLDTGVLPGLASGAPTRTIGYGYDSVDRLTSVAETTGGTSTRYTQDLAAPLSQVLSDGTASYVYGADRLAGVTGGVRTWCHVDLLGSVRQTTSDAGVVQGLAHYDAWGVLASGSVALAPFGFTGELQQGSDVSLRARWYNAARGGFGSRDPFAGYNEQPYSLHPYQYGYSNTVSNTDPSGYCPFCVAILLGAVAGGAIDYAGQVIYNFADGQQGVSAFTNVDPEQIASSALYGAIGGAVGFALTPAIAGLPIFARINSPIIRSILIGATEGSIYSSRLTVGRKR